MVLACGASQATRLLVQLNAFVIDKEDLIKENQWRRKWPYGIDTGEDDTDVFNMKDEIRARSHKKHKVVYNWRYSD